jgi:two-component system, OmpR family, sensor histidine kinase KdpD
VLGRVLHALAAIFDIAGERERVAARAAEAESAQRADVAKTAVLHAISHDLRSPLTAIVAAADGLGSPTVTAEERDELSAVIAIESRRLSRLVEQLLDLSRLEAGAVEPRADWVSLDEALAGAIDSLDRPPGTFRLSVPPDLPLVRADGGQLERAFANVLENAARHSGGHPVSVRARAVGNRVLVRIVDRGPGIPRAQRPRVFEPFYRAGTEESGHRGSGLGLAIARGLVTVNGGRIWVESLAGQGATFAIEFPLEPSQPRAPAEAVAEPTR